MAPLRLPPNPFDRWARSESGLHLPSRFVSGAAKRMHHIEKFGQCQCCCGGDDDSCSYCTLPTSAADDIYLTVDIDVTSLGCNYVQAEEVIVLTSTVLTGGVYGWSGGFEDITCPGSVKWKFVFDLGYNCVSGVFSWLLSATAIRYTWGSFGWENPYQAEGTLFQSDVLYSTTETGDCLQRTLTEEGDPFSLDYSYGSATAFINASISYS